MTFIKAFETFQIRWNIEVMNKETKGYLGLGAYQGRDFDGLIADCTLCYVTYTVMSLAQRFAQYETMGELFRENGRSHNVTPFRTMLNTLLAGCYGDIDKWFEESRLFK